MIREKPRSKGFMKKRYRFLIILAVIAVGFYFVWPSIRWYFLTPQTEKDIAESSRNQIKVYAQERADTAIKDLIAAGEAAPVPQQYAFMIDKARVRYRSAEKPTPAVWTVKDVLGAYTSRDDATADAEDWYRTGMLDLKDMKNQTMQLGLDLRGGMYVTTQLDYASYEKDTGSRLTQAERDDKMKQVMEVLRNKIDQFGLADPSLRPVGNDR